MILYNEQKLKDIILRNNFNASLQANAGVGRIYMRQVNNYSARLNMLLCGLSNRNDVA